MNEPILQVKGLRVGFDHPQGLVQAVDDVSFALAPGERLGWPANPARANRLRRLRSCA